MGKASSKILLNAAWTPIDEKDPSWFGDNHYVNLSSLGEAQINLCSCIFTCKGSWGSCHPWAALLSSLSARVCSWPPRRKIQGTALLNPTRVCAFCQAPLSALSVAPFCVLLIREEANASLKLWREASSGQFLHRENLTWILGCSRDLLTIKWLE